MAIACKNHSNDLKNILHESNDSTSIVKIDTFHSELIRYSTGGYSKPTTGFNFRNHILSESLNIKIIHYKNEKKIIYCYDKYKNDTLAFNNNNVYFNSNKAKFLGKKYIKYNGKYILLKKCMLDHI